MLTDIFSRRYQNVPLWQDFDEATRRLLVQGFRIVSEQLFPYYVGGKVKNGAKELWDGLNKQLAMELGVNDLSTAAYSYTSSYQGKSILLHSAHPPITVCKNFVCADYDGSVPADRFIKERLSFIEIAFRKKGKDIALLNSNLDNKIAKSNQQLLNNIRSGRAYPVVPHDMSDGQRLLRNEQAVRDQNTKENQAYLVSCDELNTRMRQAGVNLNYHNGLIQISSDDTIADQIERPFWTIVSAPRWKNVDHDMKEAIDRRDSAGRDPAFYAAKALESAIKIISEEKGWTSGKEMGAKSYLDNLRSKKNHEYINAWEHESLVGFFSNVRNSLGHGSGSSPMAEFTPSQTDWTIEFCMIWIKNLIRRMQL